VDETSDVTRVKPTRSMVPQYARDEQLYHRVCDGIVSLRRIEITQTEQSPYRLLVCSSSETSPMLINIVSSLTVHTLSTPANQSIGV